MLYVHQYLLDYKDFGNTPMFYFINSNFKLLLYIS